MRDIICPRLCRYHKPGKIEDPGCGGLEWLLTRPALAEAVRRVAKTPGDLLHGLDPADPRLLTVCGLCDFQVDGCDFRDPQVPRDQCEPCGGLQAVAALLAAGEDLGL